MFATTAAQPLASGRYGGKAVFDFYFTDLTFPAKNRALLASVVINSAIVEVLRWGHGRV
jgi:hypothetical protein